jgi:hypothetical protein
VPIITTPASAHPTAATSAISWNGRQSLGCGLRDLESQRVGVSKMRWALGFIAATALDFVDAARVFLSGHSLSRVVT